MTVALVRIERARRRDEQADRAERQAQQQRANLRVSWQSSRGFLAVTNAGPADAAEVRVELRSLAPGEPPLSLLADRSGHGSLAAHPGLAAYDTWELMLVMEADQQEQLLVLLRWRDSEARTARRVVTPMPPYSTT